jgi:hypothetical protein
MPFAAILAVMLFSRVAQPAELDDSRAFVVSQEATPDPTPNLAPPWRLPPGEGTTARAEQRTWYGYQLVLSDLISVGILAAGAFSYVVTCEVVLLGLALASQASAGGSGAPPTNACPIALGFGVVGLGTFTVVPAIIHLAHGRVGAAGGSLALRIALPLVLGLAFPPAGVVALLVGAVIDDAFLSYEPRP